MDDVQDRLIRALAGRYAIEGKAGQGGMATIYRATDIKHHRAVAIKVLRPELAATIGPERFLREIEVSARLQHPHIVPLYDSGDAGGVLYYIMPFVEGESLRDRLTREGHIPFEEAVALTREVASALAYAHGQGIVHRDIKPENILLSGGHAVVADFGIARALSAAAQGQAGTTGLGIAIGTPAYMSPEQATASEVDARSDQYSLACVFFEMTTGATPFAAPSVQGVLTQSLTGPRPRLSRANRAIPTEADPPVARAMASDPARRFDSVMAFATELEHAAGGGRGAVAERRRLRRMAIGFPVAFALLAALWVLFGPRRTGPVKAGAESIAVMPFTTSGPGVELMGEGMVDLLSTNLNSVGGIRAVEPRTVMTRLKKSGLDAGLDLQAALGIAREVKASAALLGSIIASGPRVRLSAQLYGRDGSSLAQAQVDGASDSVLALVDQLSLSLVREIWRSKEPVPSLRVSGLTTTSLPAMRAYLEGERFYRGAEWDSAAAAFGRAIEHDSTFALANYRLAASFGWRGGLGNPRATAASDAALRFAGRLPPRERSLVTAYNLFTHGKLAATDSMRTYVAQNPEDVDGWFLLGESQYHTRNLVGYDDSTLRSPFDRVIALDSTLTPAAIHPLELTLLAQDSGRFHTYFRVLERAANKQEVQAYAGGGEMTFGGGTVDSVTAAAMQRYQASQFGLLGYMTRRDAPSDSVLAVVERWTAIFQNAPVNWARAGRGLALGGLGRFGEAYALGDSLRRETPDQGYGVLVWPLILGFAPPGFAVRETEQLLTESRRDAYQVIPLIQILLQRGRTTEAARLVDSMLVADSVAVPRRVKAVLRAMRGWLAVERGDTADGIQVMRTGLEEAGGFNSWMTAPVRLRLATTMAAWQETRDEGIRMLQHSFDTDMGSGPLLDYALARAYEGAGRRAEAADAYSRFLRQWDKADTLAAGRIAEVKAALERVTGE
jgi:tRNA A-37 threonylcarbamoyl transferase component Bud32/TolB-like protein